jgi:hypothetical protein
MIGPDGSLIKTHIDTIMSTGRSMIRSIDDMMISIHLLMMRHHAVIATPLSSIIGIHPIQLSTPDESGIL